MAPRPTRVTRSSVRLGLNTLPLLDDEPTATHSAKTNHTTTAKCSTRPITGEKPEEPKAPVRKGVGSSTAIPPINKPLARLQAPFVDRQPMYKCSKKPLKAGNKSLIDRSQMTGGIVPWFLMGEKLKEFTASQVAGRILQLKQSKKLNAPARRASIAKSSAFMNLSSATALVPKIKVPHPLSAASRVPMSDHVSDLQKGLTQDKKITRTTVEATLVVRPRMTTRVGSRQQ